MTVCLRWRIIEMVTCEELGSLYDSTFFSQPSGSFTIHESEPNNGLEDVMFSFSGNVIQIHGLLKKSKDLYSTTCLPSLSLRKNCDGLVLVEYKERRFLVSIELKSGFNEVCRSAVFQLYASTLKARGLLGVYHGVLDCIPVSIICSFLKTPDDRETPAEYKNSLVLANGRDDVIHRFRRIVNNDRCFRLSADDFEADRLPLDHGIVPPVVFTRHCSVPQGSHQFQTDLDLILDGLIAEYGL